MIEEKLAILIAEDDDDIRSMYISALESKDYKVFEARDGKEAIKQLDENGNYIDLILLDIVMPVMDGFETLEKIKKNDLYSKIPLIVSTNLDNADDKREALVMGADEYFVKSHHKPSELVEIVHKIIEDKK